MEILQTQNAPAAIGPYSQATIVGKIVFVSGQLPLNPATGILEDDPAKATDQALKNIAAILAEKNLTLANVAKVNIFLRDMKDFAAVNEAYATHFTAPYPARACVAVKELPKSAVLEIEAIAQIK